MTCHYCGQAKELRPYGPNSAMVCFDCAMATPERKAETERNMELQFAAIKSPAVIGSEAGPYPAAHHPMLADLISGGD